MPLGYGPPPTDRVRIVIADDDRFFVELLRTALEEHDEFDVVGIAGNGQEAVARAEELKPSLVVMDVSMPVVDGIEATRLLQEFSDPPAVILITANDGAEDAAAFEAGAAAYLRKSRDVPRLIPVMLTVLGATVPQA